MGAPDLSAWLLGELPPDEAAAVERAVDRDPALRAEKARLEATIGAVRDAFPAGDALSGAARAELLAEAERLATERRASRRPLAIGPFAAVAAALLIGLAVKLATISAPTSGPFDGRSAGETMTASAVGSEESAATNDSVPRASIQSHDSQLASLSSELRDGRDSVVLARRVVDEPSAAVTPEPPPLRLRRVFRATDAEPDWNSLIGTELEKGLSDASILTIHSSNPNPVATAKEEYRRWAVTIEETRAGYTPAAPPVDEKLVAFLRYAAEPSSVTTPVLGGTVLYDAATPLGEASVVDEIVASCRRRPNERPSMMYFRFWGDHAFQLAALDPQSTFAVDVDTASYSLARRYLNEGLVPEKAQVRTEEFVNAFAPDVPPPTDGTFRVALELADSRFGGGEGTARKWLLRVALRGKEVTREDRTPLRLTFVVDTSGSMKQENRLELVKHALRLLVHQLDARDALAIVTFANEARLHLPMTGASDKAAIETAIHALAADGGTNAEAGLLLGYGHAAEHRDPEASSRVVLLSDGVANVGETDQARITAKVAEYKASGIGLNTVGVGLGNHNDVLLEQLADRGDGLCSYVDSPAEAKRALVDRFVGAFQPIARDVKIQVDFDPFVVRRYRLLGYENRAIADADFRNDAVDAGEVGAGHQVTALYEIEPGIELIGAVAPARVATARVRWLPPHGQGDDATELAATIERKSHVPEFARTSSGFRRATLVAQFAELLRRSTHARGDSLDGLIHEATKLERERSDPELSEFVELVRKSRGLVLEQLPTSDPLTQAVDAVRKNAILKAELEELAAAEDVELLDSLERENKRLEQQLRELLERRLNSDGRDGDGGE